MDTTTAKEQRLQIKRVDIGTLMPDPANARRHGEENMAAIEASLRRFGQAEPLVVHAASKRVVGGNGRLAAMKRLGWTQCDVVELDVSELDATALGIALNRTGELAEWDDEALSRLLRTLSDEGVLDGVGFDEGELDDLIAELEGDQAEELADPGPGDVPDDPTTRVGDLWVLGEHRLLCGDSTEEESFIRVLQTERADLLWSDPPYGVSYVGKTADALTIENERKGPSRPAMTSSGMLRFWQAPTRHRPRAPRRPSTALQGLGLTMGYYELLLVPGRIVVSARRATLVIVDAALESWRRAWSRLEAFHAPPVAN